MTYKVPEDYDYATGRTLKKDAQGRVIPGQLTPNTLNHILFGVPISRDNPNREYFKDQTLDDHIRKKGE